MALDFLEKNQEIIYYQTSFLGQCQNTPQLYSCKFLEFHRVSSSLQTLNHLSFCLQGILSL